MMLKMVSKSLSSFAPFLVLTAFVSGCGFSTGTSQLSAKPARGVNARVSRTGATPTPSPSMPTTPVDDSDLVPTYASIYTHIIKERCDTCHGKGSLLKRYPLSPYATLLASPKGMIAPKDPEHSSLVLAVERLDDDQMPPANKPQLTQLEKTTIREWVKNGAIEK